ncbi:hypothetical protein MNBD_GAMMA17-1687 [hydrothermal vent metagenome]|uniref:Uncharacterized protein n=1 Tax=hydrothermal vent metagenome TaxID=652676 RepID=A0A3B0ZFE7_9ZZZZ
MKLYRTTENGKTKHTKEGIYRDRDRLSTLLTPPVDKIQVPLMHIAWRPPFMCHPIH